MAPRPPTTNEAFSCIVIDALLKDVGRNLADDFGRSISPINFVNYLQTQDARSYFLTSAKRTTNLASINMTPLRSLSVPVPSLSAQAEFVDRVADVPPMDRQNAAAKNISTQMIQSLLHSALRGKF